MVRYYAHSTLNLDRSDWQTLQEHLEGVASVAATAADKFGAADWGRLAGLLHDAGKYSNEFQRRLTGDPSRVDHSTAGAILASNQWAGAVSHLLAFPIAGHHAGLANGTGSGERSPLSDRLKSTIPDASAYAAHIQLPKTPPQLSLKPANKCFGFSLSHFTRMIFSTLVDADRIDTERFYSLAKPKSTDRGNWPPLAVLQAKLDTTLAKLQAQAEVSEVNTLRATILAHARARAIEPPGHFSLTVPTGGGKTLASLAFALEHAITHNLDRVIYVIPYTSIIEQTADVFRAALGECGDCVLEHHSAFDDETLIAAARKLDKLEQGLQGRDKLRLASENWDVPIVVTTAVQFFESLFSNTPSRCRKLHNIAKSVVILDEAQTMPLPLLRPTVAMLGELATNYKTSIVLCTATQPALLASTDPDKGFRDGLQDVREIAPDPIHLYSSLKRVTVKDIGPIDDIDLVARLSSQQQALCIVHTRAHARELYLGLKSQPGTVHLSALMCPEHRSEQLSEIKQRLRDKQSCRLIATSLIEAGVDVDFPVVFRASAGLDSIAQAAGRCNREGRRPAEASYVYVFEPKGRKLPVSMTATTEAGREIMRRFPDDPLSLAAIEAYFQTLYWRKSAGQHDGLDKHGILQSLEEHRGDLLFPFEDIARDFRLIGDATRPVLIPFQQKGQRDNRGRKLIEELSSTDNVSAIARKLQRFVVQVPHGAFAGLKAAGAIQAVNPARFDDQFWRLESVELYHDEFGLDWSDPTFREAEKLVL